MSSSNSPSDSQSPPIHPNPSSSSSSINNGGRQPVAPTPGDASTAVAAAEKSISCVSCRRRKLKCDRAKPQCGTCYRLKHDCEYPERRRNVGSKRRNMKELEARLAEVETRLVSETSKNTPPQKATPPLYSMEADWNNFPLDMGNVDMNLDLGNDMLMDNFPPPEPAIPFGQVPISDFHEIISLGLQEPLPPNDMIDDLHQIYFDKFHPTMPMIHKGRYLAGLKNPPHMRPPICLRYAMWMIAASISDNYMAYEDLFYERARKYIQDAEMKGQGEAFVTVQHTQTWGLLSTYEAMKTYFTRAWMSTGRMVRLVHMLSLHRIDAGSDGQRVKQILPPPKDWIEAEERRRAFWTSFYCDRWASSGTGWPMIIDEKTIQTHLPSSEESFEQGTAQPTLSFQDALTPGGVSSLTSFGGVVLSACLFGHNFQHLHQTGPEERPENLATGEFWKRHRKMDNILSSTFMFLPDHLRLPAGIRDMNVVFLHMNIHASSICLHQAAVATAEKHKVSRSFVAQSRARSLMAAEEIANNMRLITHLDASDMNSWMGFCLYVASGVFIQDLVHNPNPQSKSNLEFLLAAMKAMGRRHSISQHFSAQVELDISGSGIDKGRYQMVGVYSDSEVTNAAKSSDHGIDLNGNFLPMRVSQVCSVPLKGNTSAPFNGILPNSFNRNIGQASEEPIKLTPLYGVISMNSRESSPKGSPKGSPNVFIVNNFASKMTKSNAATRRPMDQRMSSVTTASSSSESRAGTESFDHLSGLDFNDPLVFPDQHRLGDTGTSSTGSEGLPQEIPLRYFASPKLSETHFPYRQVDPSNLGDGPYSVFPNDAGAPASNGSSQQPGQAGWAFNHAMDKYKVLNPGSNIEQNSNDDQMFMDMNGDWADEPLG